ncbi:hypothetical protein [Prescottella subtropica]|uniref:hypothetical protein n=1 Tax=Prescottella subtropica TaxID=2545757 RepID=UPI0010F5872E|nr:hypothetical protein [Prescottella subtropica]
MTTNVRALLTAAAALFGGALGTYALISPPEWYGAFSASPRQLQSWLSAVPTAVAIGTVVAVLAYGAVQRARTTRPSWVTAAVATVVLVAIRFAVHGADDVGVLTLLHYGKCIAAGILLGATVAAAWARPLPRLALVTAVASTFVLAHGARADWSPSTSTLGEPSWWILVPALVLTIGCAVTVPTGRHPDEPARAIPEVAGRVAVAAVTLAVAHRLLGAWIDGQDTSRFRLWIVIGISLVLVVSLTELWARRSRSPFLFAATAVAATVPFVATVLWRESLHHLAWAVVLVGVATVAAGVVAAPRLPSPVIGPAVLAVIPIWTLIDPTPSDGAGPLLVELAVLGAGIGLTLGATLPGSGTTAALGLVVPLLSLVFTTVVDITTRFTIYTASYEPLPGVPSAVDSPSDTNALLVSSADAITFDRLAAAALLLVVVFCGLALRGVRSVDESEFPESGEDEA